MEMKEKTTHQVSLRKNILYKTHNQTVYHYAIIFLAIYQFYKKDVFTRTQYNISSEAQKNL